MNSTENAALIEQFYTAFANKDAEAMVALYHNDVTFSDPAFGTLHGDRAKNMWRMLIERGGENMSVKHKGVSAENESGKASWQANYLYGKKARPVINKVQAAFTFKGGKIFEHHDEFDQHAWAKQAMGFTGMLLGGTNFFKKKIQATTNGMLDKFEAKS